MSTLKRFKLSFIVILLPALLTGCNTTLSIGADFSEETLNRIVTGRTARQEVINILGHPMDIVTMGKSTSLFYESANVEVDNEIAKVSTRRLTIVLDEIEIVKEQKMVRLYKEQLHSSRDDSWTRLDEKIRDRH